LWQPATFEEFVEKAELKSLIDEGFIQESDMLFHAVFERNKSRFGVFCSLQVELRQFAF